MISRHQPLKHQTVLRFPAIKIIADASGWGCGGSQENVWGMFGAKHKSCRLLVIKFPDFNKLHVNFGNQTLIGGIHTSGKAQVSDNVSERAPQSRCFSCYCWSLVLGLPKAISLRSVDAFCRQCVRGGVFYGAPSRTCLEGCCCKSCVIWEKKQKNKTNRFPCLPGFVSTNLRDIQIDVGLQPYLPGTSSFTKLLPCQHSATSPPSPRCSLCAGPMMLFSLLCACLWLSSMGSTWQRMRVAGLCLDTSVSPSLLSPRPRSVRTAVSMAIRRRALGWFLKCWRQEDLGLRVWTSDVYKC